MANDNIYDIIISEEVARLDGGTAGDGSPTVVTLLISMDANPLIASGTSLPNPITVASAITTLPTDWEVVPASNQIYFDLMIGGGWELQPSTGTDEFQTAEDTNGGTAGAKDNVERMYYSTIVVRERANPTNTLIINSEVLKITAVTTIYYGFFADTSGLPTNIVDLDESVLSSEAILPIDSNNVLPVPAPGVGEWLYIAILTGDPQPLAIKDEHGLISHISDWSLSNSILGYSVYQSPYLTELSGAYVHTFTLIYS